MGCFNNSSGDPRRRFRPGAFRLGAWGGCSENLNMPKRYQDLGRKSELRHQMPQTSSNADDHDFHHIGVSRTSILPVTAAAMRAVRSSLRRSMASWTLATRAPIFSVSRFR